MQKYVIVKGNKIINRVIWDGIIAFPLNEGESIIKETPELLAQYIYPSQDKTVEQMVKDKVEAAIALGREIIVEYGVRNTLRGLSTQEVSDTMVQLSGIIALLNAGALDTARTAIQALQPDGVRILQTDKDYFLQKINEFLQG